MSPSQPIKKIAILGGGLGSLTTAFALTSQRDWRSRYEITVYQVGWRLGGKGASGRNAEPGYGQRIEEHGFHVWMGFYDNAFKMIKDTYAELARTTGPFRDWTDAFKKHSHVVIEEVDQGERKRWQVEFPTGLREPGTFVQLGLLGYAARMFKLLYKRLPDAPPHKQAGVAPVVRQWQRIWRTAFIGLLLVLALAEYFLRLGERWVRRQLGESRIPGARAVFNPLATLLGWVVRTARAVVEASSQIVIAWAAAGEVSDRDDGRRLRIFFDLSLSVLRGILVDDIIANGFESIDHLEFKDWLRRHNARPESVDSAIVDSIYDGNFSFTGGDPTRPNFAAGVALHCFLRIFLDYKGALLYKMQAGMGDVVIAPLFQVLEKRGVRFKFFHRVDELVLDPATQQITAIEMTEQVAVKDGEYRPLITVPVADGEIACWPSQPRFDLIQDGDTLKASGINLESQWAQPWKDSTRKRLVQGIDYDLVVLGISIGALGSICRQLVEHLPKWRDMIEKVDTVATQAMQLWLSPNLPALGWPLRSTMVVNYESPGANWLDASQVIPFERLPPQIGSVAYFCSVLRDPPAIPAAGPATFPVDQRRGVQQAHQRWIEQHAAHLWPALTSSPGGRALINWDLLHDPDNRHGAARLDWQYFRANVEPSDRFVLSSVDATRFRLRPDESGAGNLYLAGDWTCNKFNGGCVEGTVMSGLLCSRAIAGHPRSIFGERPFGIFGV
jgi:uncharacterized protein with NAD-binding domain and iron-sulfur cluster